MAEPIRCKFEVSQVAKNKGWSQVKLDAVADDGMNEENAKFFGATPFGQLDLHVTNESVNELEPGQAYYVDLTPVEQL